MKQTNEKEWGLMIFQSTFEYLIDGDLNNDQFCELMRCIYNLRQNGELPDMDNMDKAVRLVWRSCQHTVRKSIRNANYYSRKKKVVEQPAETAIDTNGPEELMAASHQVLEMMNNRTENEPSYDEVPQPETEVYEEPVTVDTEPEEPQECQAKKPSWSWEIPGRCRINDNGVIEIISNKRPADVPKIFEGCKQWISECETYQKKRAKDADFDQKYREYAIGEVQKQFKEQFSRDILAVSYDNSKCKDDR